MNIAVATRFQCFVVNDKGEFIGEILPPDYALHHYGITWNNEFMFVYCWCKGGHWIEVLDKNLNSVDRILGPPLNISDAHQISWSPEANQLWVCATNRERFIISDANGRIQDIWMPWPERGWKRPTGPHFNSVWFDGKGHVYIVASNWGTRDADVLCYKLDEVFASAYRYVRPGAFRAHSIFMHEGEPLTLGIGSIRWGEKDYPLPQCEVMKGIVYADNRMFFGVQQNIPDRATRHEARSGWICEVNPETMEAINMINFGRGQVNEIRALDVPDLAHHGMPWRGKYGA